MVSIYDHKLELLISMKTLLTNDEGCSIELAFEDG